MRVERVAILAFLMLAIVAVYLNALHPHAPYIHGSTFDFVGAEHYWTERIETVGTSTAYGEFFVLGNSLSPYQAHLLAHAFGAGLYDAEGSAGFATCTSVFQEGCAHQFIGMAIAHDGLTAIKSLYEACQKQGTTGRGCSHSIGHGVLGYLGYSTSSLSRALALCDSVDTSGERSGCADGTYMEYNLRFLTAESGTYTPRPLGSDIYAPCDESFSHQSTCYFELPRWWIQSATTSPTSAFKLLGERCAAAPQDVRSCFEGIGVVAGAVAGDESADAVKICNIASASELGRLYCDTGVVRRLKIEGRADYSAPCTNGQWTGLMLAYCRAYAAAPLSSVDDILPPVVK